MTSFVQKLENLAISSGLTVTVKDKNVSFDVKNLSKMEIEDLKSAVSHALGKTKHEMAVKQKKLVVENVATKPKTVKTRSKSPKKSPKKIVSKAKETFATSEKDDVLITQYAWAVIRGADDNNILFQDSESDYFYFEMISHKLKRLLHSYKGFVKYHPEHKPSLYFKVDPKSGEAPFQEDLRKFYDKEDKHIANLDTGIVNLLKTFLRKVLEVDETPLKKSPKKSSKKVSVSGKSSFIYLVSHNSKMRAFYKREDAKKYMLELSEQTKGVRTFFGDDVIETTLSKVKIE